MKTVVEFSVTIDAPPARVWHTLFGVDTYSAWTAPFCEGSTFEGSWEQGEAIRFLAPNGDGMVAVIAANRPHEFLSIRHLGEIAGGIEDTTSESVQAWAPAHEDYHLTAIEGGTRLDVRIEILASYGEFMTGAFPKALDRLKELCETGP